MSKAIIFAYINDFNVGDVSEMKLTDRQLKILGLVKEFPSISGRRMSEILWLVNALLNVIWQN